MSWYVYSGGTLTEHGDDETRAVYGPDGAKVRDYTEQENRAADEHVATEARMDDLDRRVQRIEAHLWPEDTTPTPTTAPTWDELDGVWPNGGLLLDGGTIWRNVSGVPLTTPPSGFPGGASKWGHLFAPATATPPAPTAPAWAKGVTYAVGDLATYNGVTYRCVQAHTSQAGWTPTAVPALWAAA